MAKTFSPSIKGIERYATVSRQVKQFILNDFTKSLTFADIAKRYGLTKQRIIQIFDEKVKYVPRRLMPKILCIDEIKFSEELDQNYCCVIYDFERREIVDIIRNRRMPYLREYFSSIPLKKDKILKYLYLICMMLIPQYAVSSFHPRHTSLISSISLRNYPGL